MFVRLYLAFAAVLTIFVGAFFYQAKSAEACGGCFSPTDQVTRVESHRMIIRLESTSATLWDQIIYSGNPEDFVWVLPVPNENVTINVAAPEFFDYIEDGTGPVVQPANPLLTFCGSGGGSSGFGCGGQIAASGAEPGDDVPDDSVEIFDQRTVGPYETVTIAAEDPAALTTWLNENGYGVTAESQPAIDHYVDEGSAFVVLRLAPGLDTNAMQPVRIDFEGFMGRFPLKMVAIGASGVLDLSLWVIADQRYDVANYGTVEMNPADITWDWSTNRSDYQVAFNQTAEANGNRAWIAEYAANLDELLWRGQIRSVPEQARDDLRIAAQGNVPFITRLRTRILVDHIDADLELAPAENPQPLTGLYFAEKELNRPADPECASAAAPTDDGAACRAGSTHRATAPMLLLLVAMLLIRRRRRLRLPSWLRR